VGIDTKKLEVILSADPASLKGGMQEASAAVKKFGADAAAAAKQVDKIELGPDISGFKKKVREAREPTFQFSRAIKETGDEAEKAGKKLDETGKTASMFGKAMGAAAAAAIIGFSALIKHQIDLADSTLKMSQRVGLSVEQLSAMGQSAKLNGASIDILNEGINAFAKSASKAAGGAKLHAEAFKAMGISVTDSVGKMRPMDALLQEVARKFASYGPGATKVALANRLMGESGSTLLQTLDELGVDGFDALIEKAQKAGTLITTETAVAAEQFNDNLDILKNTVIALANEAMTQLLPQINVLTGLMLETGSTTAGASKEVGALERIFNVVAKAGLIIKNVLDALGITIVALGKSAWAAGLLLTDMITAPARATAAFATDGVDGVKKVIGSLNASAQSVKGTWADALSAFKQGWSEAGSDILAGADKLDAAMNKTADGSDAARAAIDAAAAAAAAGQAPFLDYGTASNEAARAARAQESALGRLADITDRLGGKMDPLDKVTADYNITLRDIKEAADKATEAQTRLGAAGVGLTAITERKTAAENAATAAKEHAIEAILRERDVTGNTLRDLATETRLIGLSTSAQRVETVVQRALAEAKKQNLEVGKEIVKVDQERIRQQATLNEALSIAAEVNQKSPFQELIDQADTLGEQIKKGIQAGFDPIFLKPMQDALAKLHKQITGPTVGAFLELGQTVVGSMKDSAKEGSRHYAALEVAQSALALGQGINAILTQGQGDPYTAFGRMAAMAAVVIPLAAQLGASISSFGSSGFSDTAANRQATQGTGSVLGDTTAKSETIANDVEITANATTALVAINRGMLNALLALQAGLGSAATMLARGAGTADFSGMNLAVGNNSLMSNSINDPFGFFGGSSKITDEGIIIFAGALNDLLNGIAVGAYQEVQSRSWAFGSTHTNEGITAVSDEFANQFQLIVQSITDAVREGATALGLVPEDIQAALDAFRVEEIRISLKGLTAEEQQAELAAVFGQLFDGLAASVVPFISQFQQVGEGLGETLIRVATEVQVVQESMRYLGIAINETDPERFAQISDGLIQMAGGIDKFISGMTSFANNFAPEAYQFQVASDSLASALEQVGLAVPGTKDGMWALMQSLDATTESGREQITTLLRLSDVAAQYYQLLDKQVSEATKLLDSLGLSTNGLSAFGQQLASITESGRQAEEAANTIALAQGREGASTIQLAKIHQWTASQIAKAISMLVQQTQDLIAQLYGGIPGSLDAINARIAELEGATVGLSDGIGAVADAGANLFESWLSGIQSINDYLNSMLFGDLSALTPEEQLAEAQRQLLALQAQAMAGDTNALSQLPQMADQFLQLLQGSGASGEDYNTGWQWVRDLLQSVVGLPNPGTRGGNGSPAPVELVPSQELRDLYAARDAAQAAQDLEQRREWAQQLAQNLADMASIFRVSVLDLIESRGVSLAALAADLGVALDNLNAASVQALGDMAVTLGLSLSTLTDALGVGLTDLRGGLTEITDSMGIDLDALTVSTTQTLAALAASLGANLADLSTALGIDLGSLTDATSLVSQGLGAEIGALPQDQRDALAPLFDAIATATTQADANAAIAALADAVNAIGGDTANMLAPYLAGVMPVRALDQLDFLSQIHDIAGQQLDVLGLIRDNLRAANAGQGVPSYAVGTGYVPRTGLALIHQGEAILPAPVADFHRRAGFPAAGGGASDPGVVVELRAIRERLESLERSNSAGHDKTATTVYSGDKDARVQREDLDRRNRDTRRSPA
jgi:hypothetical protein